jgi:hypothetical protein
MQHLMHEGDRDRSFADGRRNPFDVSGAHAPTAKTRGRLVSRRCGWRESGHPAAARSSGVRSGPVLTKPLLSSATHPHAQLRGPDLTKNPQISLPAFFVVSRTIQLSG